MKFNFLIPTIFFSIGGLFIPGFTALGLLLAQMLLSSFGIECSDAWNIIWVIASILCIALPIVLLLRLKRIKKENIALVITFFNILEYTAVQCSLAVFFTSGHTLCYVSDGQNGIELMFTGWLSIPVLLLLSLAFDFIYKRVASSSSI